MKPLQRREIERIVANALDEDIGRGDITSRTFIPGSARGTGAVVYKEAGIVCGLPILQCVFRRLNRSILVRLHNRDGDVVKSGKTVAMIEGKLRDILAGERVALNFLQRLSGIATMTKRFVEMGKGYAAAILDTRKTTPGLRVLEKYAVRVGGGRNHRMGLSDAVLIKTNHLKAISPRELSAKISAAKKSAGKAGFVEIEASSIAEAVAFADTDVDIVMLDNFSLPDIRKAVAKIRARRPSVKIEVSGGIGLRDIRSVAATGVDRISVGALTHSCRSLDISLQIKEAE